MNENISLNNYPIEQVSVSNLKNYLTDRGWNQEQFGREEVLKFKSPQPIQGQEYFEILIPSKKGNCSILCGIRRSFLSD